MSELQIGQEVTMRHPEDKYPDWNRGRITGFSPRNLLGLDSYTYIKVLEGPNKGTEGSFSQRWIITPIGPVESAYAVARRIAESLGKANKFVTADDVQAELLKQGYTSADLGNAAGPLFRKSKSWKDTGKTVNSKRKGAHSRKITVWEYIPRPGLTAAQALASITPAVHETSKIDVGAKVTVTSGYTAPGRSIVGAEGTVIEVLPKAIYPLRVLFADGVKRLFYYHEVAPV
jgi:hypothetical protein